MFCIFILYLVYVGGRKKKWKILCRTLLCIANSLYMKHRLKIVFLNSPLQILPFIKYILLANDVKFLRKISPAATCLIFVEVGQLTLDIVTTE